MNRLSKSILGFAAALASAGALTPKASADDFGVWTSASQVTNTGTATLPTSYGYITGDMEAQVGTLSLYSSIPGYGNPTASGYSDTLENEASNAPGYLQSSFTPYSYSVLAGAWFDPVQTGNLTYHGEQAQVVDTVTFHLDQPTAYSITPNPVTAPLVEDSGTTVLTVANYLPTLTGPGAQTITINGAMNGTLAAGDWQLSINVQGVYTSDVSASQYKIYSPQINDQSRNTAFVLTVPEPGGVLVSLMGVLVGIGRRRR